MGEARRRRMAAENGGPVEEFRVPDGDVALTWDVEGFAPTTWLVPAANTATLIEEVHRQVAGMGYYSVVRGILRSFRAMRDAKDVTGLAGLGCMTLWSVFHHPSGGDSMRRRVSELLRQTNSAHITWNYTTAGLMISVSERFRDLDQVAAAARRANLSAPLIVHAGEPGEQFREKLN